MITLSQWLGPYQAHVDATEAVKTAASFMLDKVNDLLLVYADEGNVVRINPKTTCQVSGAGNGGFRPSDSTVGAPLSKHKTGHAVDLYDPDGALDAWLTDELLEEFSLYREHPDYTNGWCHLQDVPPRSGNRTFLP